MKEGEQMEFSKLTEKKLRGEKVYSGSFLQVYRDIVALPDGNEASREYIQHMGAACVVPITESGDVVMVRQYRYPIGKETLEIPAGKMSPTDGNPEEAARRELLEETGAKAETMTYLGEFYPLAAYSDEVIHMFVAEGLSFGESHPDEDEFLSVELVPLEKLVDEIMQGNVPDAKTQAAVLRAYLKRKRE